MPIRQFCHVISNYPVCSDSNAQTEGTSSLGITIIVCIESPKAASSSATSSSLVSDS